MDVEVPVLQAARQRHGVVGIVESWIQRFSYGRERDWRQDDWPSRPRRVILLVTEMINLYAGAFSDGISVLLYHCRVDVGYKSIAASSLNDKKILPHHNGSTEKTRKDTIEDDDDDGDAVMCLRITK